jgi:hypothetical protein
MTMLSFDKMEYLAAMWFVGSAPGDLQIGRDWVAVLFRAKGDSQWKGEYRFRYYHPGGRDPFDEKDQKNWYGFTVDSSDPRNEDDLISCVDLLANEIAVQWGVTVDRVDIKGKPELLIQKASGRHWLHLKVVPR